MHHVVVVTTKNSVYVAKSKQGGSDVELLCLVGTFEGQTFKLTRKEWANSHIEVGEQAHFLGALVTSRVEQVEDFYCYTQEERNGEHAWYVPDRVHS